MFITRLGLVLERVRNVVSWAHPMKNRVVCIPRFISTAPELKTANMLLYRPLSLCLFSIACGSLLTQSGCSTLLSAGGLQDALQGSSDVSTIATYDQANDDKEVTDDSDDATDSHHTSTLDASAAQAVLDDALDQLAQSGHLTPATQDALMTAVQDAPPEDWPDIIDAFVATIASTPSSDTTITNETEEEMSDSEPSSSTLPDTSFEEKENTSSSTTTKSSTQDDDSAQQESPESSSNTQTPSSDLAIINACFASKVTGWGALDRFENDAFVSGQEIIVYFELENLSGNKSPDGYTTQITTVLELVGESGQQFREWSFEPLQEESLAIRRDYFARYIITIPDDVPAGNCHVKLSVTDSVAESTAHAELPLSIMRASP